MKTENNERPINLKVVKFELNFVPPMHNEPIPQVPKPKVRVSRINFAHKSSVPAPPINKIDGKPDVHHLINALLEDLYSESSYTTGSTCPPSISSIHSVCEENSNATEVHYLDTSEVSELVEQTEELRRLVGLVGERLGRCVRARDRYRRQQKRLCAAFTAILRHISGDATVRFGVSPADAEGGYSEWLHAMRLVARLPAGVPLHFRKKLWLTLAEKYLTSCGVDWSAAERACFRGTALPDDGELGAQILKDLHRTGCSLFCGAEGRENQAMLRRVLLAYARWNKEVGYCQGFNMLAAIILEVMDKSESDSLKVMIYLVEAVLPEGYFAGDLRGLSADMAAFRDLLRLRLPRLANHMDYLQKMSDGGGVEPPLPDVFTMQWFLTLYATWLPRDSLLRIWDLVLLDGNEVLLLTALAIWDMLQDRILSARSADEYYCCMGGGAGAIWEAGDALVGRVVALGSAPELPRLRNLHRYRITPPVPADVPPPPLHSAMQTMTKKGLRLFYSEDEGDSSDDGNKMALATVVPRRDERLGAGDRLTLDIGALKRQYARLRERQRQAHVILAAACARHAAVGVPTSPTSLTVNSLLLGRSAIVSTRGRRLGPPPGSIPPSRQTSTKPSKPDDDFNDRTNETISWMEEKHKKSLCRRNSLKWKDVKRDKTKKSRKASIEIDEAGDGVILSETEANEMIASLRSRSSSESSSYSSHSSTSTDTSLCDDRLSDSETELQAETDDKQCKFQKSKKLPSQKPQSIERNYIESEKSVVDFKHDTVDLKNIIDSSDCSDTKKQLNNLNEFLSKPFSETQSLPVPCLNVSKCKSPVFSSEFKKSEESDILSLNKTFYSKDIPNLSRSDLSDSVVIAASPVSSCQSLPSNVVDLSPIQVSPYKLHPYEDKSLYDFDINLRQPSISTFRPPDIIDNLTSIPNFVPDIDLSEKSASDFDSPLRSPGGESVVVSEDEPPIPLNIDKYFEDSPEFFGARITVTDPNNADIPTRRSTKRFLKPPRKPDSLTLQSNLNRDFSFTDDEERASSLPQKFAPQAKENTLVDSNVSSHLSAKGTEEQLSEFKSNECINVDVDLSKNKSDEKYGEQVFKCQNYNKIISPKDFAESFGRKNSERALQIIQENSKILSRILTKQNISKSKYIYMTETVNVPDKDIKPSSKTDIKGSYNNLASPLLRESTSDSLIGYSWNISNSTDNKSDFLRNRPISLDDPFCLNLDKNKSINENITKCIKSPSTDSISIKGDKFGWENKGFMAKNEYKQFSDLNQKGIEKTNPDILVIAADTDRKSTPEWSKPLGSYSIESKQDAPLSSETRDALLFESNFRPEEYSYSLSSKYNDFVLKKASDICSKSGLVPKVCENLCKSDNSKVSDFTHAVTSSISFTYEPSVEDDSSLGVSNSSDTLCQITSLDQVSTPISPKIFPRETPTLPKEFIDKSDRVKIESDDTCSAITSMLESDPLSSFSYPKSPSTGSYHPFPSRPPIRMPKELGIRLGMYPKDPINSPSK